MIIWNKQLSEGLQSVTKKNVEYKSQIHKIMRLNCIIQKSSLTAVTRHENGDNR